MTRRVLISLILLVGSFSAQAQNLKYKDLLPLLDHMGKEERKNALKGFILREDLDHPNANFRLTLIYESNYRNADVLTRNEYALANAQETLLGYSKVKQLIDEREVNRNDDYYAPLFNSVDSKGNPHVEFPAVTAKITNGLDSVKVFLEKVPPIYANFTSSVAHYDNAVKIFSKINDEFLNLDDLYLFYDPELEKRLISLKNNYDSARMFLDKYIELTKEYPIRYHKQKYHVRPIVTYRLDGLITRMNFLTDDIEFWDYGMWVDNVHKFISTEIAALRQKLEQNEGKLNENLGRINASTGEGMAMIPEDKQLVFTLNNYDKQSLALALLDYKTFKQDWLIKSKTFLPDTLNLDRNATIFSQLIYLNKSADTLITTVKNRTNHEKVRKHSGFVAKHYGGVEGLNKFVTAEKTHIQTTYDEYASGLRASLMNMITTPVTAGTEKIIKFGKWNVPSMAHSLNREQLDKGEPNTLQTRKSPDGSVYLAGVYKPDKKVNNVVTFVAKVNPDGKAGWIQSFNFKVDSVGTVPDADNYLGPIELTQEGVAFVVRSVHLSQPNWTNSLVYINDKGEQKFKVKLKEKNYARKLSFTEKSNSFILLFKGEREAQDVKSLEALTIIGVNALGDVLWRRELSVAGTVTEFVNLIDGHMLVGNYMILKDMSGKEHKTKPGESSPYMIKFSATGNVEKVDPMVTPKSVFITNVVKVNDNSINLLGLEGNFESAEGKTLTKADKPVHILANRNCHIICSNL